MLRKTIKAMGIILLVLVLTACILVALVVINDFRLDIRLVGEDEQLLEYGDVYQDPGAQVVLSGAYMFCDGLVLADVVPTVTGTLRSEKLGVYTMDYHADFLIWSAETSRKILVVDTTSPEIHLTEGPERILLPGEVFQEPGFQALDNYDGDITHAVVCKKAAGVISYEVTDSSGNTAYAQREIPQYDPIPPEIHLEGEPKYTITVGTYFEEPGYSATDNVDGDISEAVTVEGAVDWLTPGVYTLRYCVADAFLNETVIIRRVEVEAKPWPASQWPENKTIYLTFDDGPGPYTQSLLDLLDKYGVKATFFVVDSDYGDMMKQIVARGHTIGIHSVSHDYESIYADPQAYFNDLFEMQEIIYENTGIRTNLMRFPGGGSNLVSRHTCPGIMTTLTTAVQNAGFRYFDWNVDSDDAGEARSKNKVRDNVIRGIQEAGTCMVLQHDIHAYSVDAVEEIILWGMENGYVFRAVNGSTPGFHHDVLN